MQPVRFALLQLEETVDTLLDEFSGAPASAVSEKRPLTRALDKVRVCREWLVCCLLFVCTHIKQQAADEAAE